MAEQESERVAELGKRVHQQDAELSKLRAQLEHAEKRRNEYANRVLELEEIQKPEYDETQLLNRVKSALENAEHWCADRDIARVPDPFAFAFETMRKCLFGGALPNATRKGEP